MSIPRYIKPYDQGKLYIHGYVVFYSKELDMLYLWTYHRNRRFQTTWRLDLDFHTAANVTPFETLALAKTAGRVPAAAIKVHYSAVKQLGFKPISPNGSNLYASKCNFRGRCAFKYKGKKGPLCSWPYTCNQKYPLTL